MQFRLYNSDGNLEWKLTNVLNWKYVTNKKSILNIFHFVIRGENPCSMWYANYFHTSFETLILEEKKVLWARKYWIIKNLVTNRLISFGRERKKVYETFSQHNLVQQTTVIGGELFYAKCHYAKTINSKKFWQLLPFIHGEHSNWSKTLGK